MAVLDGARERRVVAIAGQAAQAGIAIEGIAAGRVRDDPEVGPATEIVDPGSGVSGRVMTYSRSSLSKWPKRTNLLLDLPMLPNGHVATSCQPATRAMAN
jgi:hypothetical protein